jgi:HEAT repeat protein
MMSPSKQPDDFHTLPALYLQVAAPVLREALKNDERAVRRRAAEGLGIIGDPSVVQLLCGALKDHDEDVRRAAVQALGKIGQRDAVQPLCEALDDKDGDVREQAAIALGQIGDPAALPALRKKVDLWSAHIFERGAARDAYYAAIDLLEGAACAPPSPSATEVTFDPATHERGLRELWRVASSAVGADPRRFWWMLDVGLVMLLRGLEGTDVEISFPAMQRLLAMWVQGEQIEETTWQQRFFMMPKDASMASLLSRLQKTMDPEAGVRAVAAWALGQTKDVKVLRALQVALNDPVSVVRRCAAEALGEIGHWDATQPLCDALNDEDNDVRGQAAIALGKIGNPAALSKLREKASLWSDSSGALRAVCHEAIEAIEKAAGGGTLPRAASAPELNAETLPRPADETESDTETLPRPAEGDEQT